LYLSIASSLF